MNFREIFRQHPELLQSFVPKNAPAPMPGPMSPQNPWALSVHNALNPTIQPTAETQPSPQGTVMERFRGK